LGFHADERGRDDFVDLGGNRRRRRSRGKRTRDGGVNVALRESLWWQFRRVVREHRGKRDQDAKRDEKQIARTVVQTTHALAQNLESGRRFFDKFGRNWLNRFGDTLPHGIPHISRD
jgi:hypothetical protein